MRLYFRLVSNLVATQGWRHLALAGLWLISGCSTPAPAPEEPTIDEILQGSISFPFGKEYPLGVNAPQEKFVIRSISGNTEYVIEIPGAGEDYDIEIPLAAIDGSAEPNPPNLPPPTVTDRELAKSLPDMAERAPAKSKFLDRAFGVGASNGPKQAPSYTLGIAKISRLYQKRDYEYALIEVNHLLTFFPQSPRLHKMKGTIYLKLHNYPLAEKAWLDALSYTPNDKVLRQGVARLQEKIKRTYTLDKVARQDAATKALPAPVAPNAGQTTPPALDAAEIEINNAAPAP